jgi:hypothetical protein
MINSTRHKCFISYHKDDKDYVEKFIREFDNIQDVFIQRSIGVMDNNIIDSKNRDYIMRKIREEYLSDSTVTIVMIGKFTWARKFIDWEIASTLRNDPVNKRSGLLAIQLPYCDDNVDLPLRLSDNIKSKYANYWKYPATATDLHTMIETAFQNRITKSDCVENSRDLFTYNRNC